MATTNVLLLEPIENLGNEGEQVSVKAGYARNFLIPRRKALPISRANKKYVDSLQARRDERLRKEKEYAEAQLAKLEKAHVAISVKTGEGGKLFGSVTANDLVARLHEEGIDIDKKQLNLYSPVKSLGKHTTKIKLHDDITYELDWEVVSENPIDMGESEEGDEEAADADAKA